MKTSAREKSGGIEDLVPRLKDQGYESERVARRRAWVEEKTGAALRHVGSYSVDSEEMRGNIENPVGAAQVPIGIAGPIRVNGKHANGTFYVPMATTEGALVRSYERGMVALTRAGGVEARLVSDENQISPSFFFQNIAEAANFAEWIPEHFAEIKEQAESTTWHGRLKNLRCHQIARQVIVSFGFETGDAQGMNMIVTASDHACRWIAGQFPASTHFQFSGMCSEKRPSGYLLTRGKGKYVTAGALLPSDILKAYLHCTARQLYDVWHSTLIGHLAANAVGYNAQYANGLTAMFIALGQDVANVVNSSCGITSFDLSEGGLYVCLTLPALSVATVGGGTGLGTQRECLEMIDCFGGGKSGKLAEIIAAALLGGEISMGAAIASGEFAAAHEHYGRNRPGQSESAG